MIKDDGEVVHFNNPKVQASLAANTFAVTGHADIKRRFHVFILLICVVNFNTDDWCLTHSVDHSIYPRRAWSLCECGCRCHCIISESFGNKLNIVKNSDDQCCEAVRDEARSWVYRPIHTSCIFNKRCFRF